MMSVHFPGFEGTFGPEEHCPHGTVATAFEARVEPLVGDNSALNGVRLYCGRDQVGLLVADWRNMSTSPAVINLSISMIYGSVAYLYCTGNIFLCFRGRLSPALWVRGVTGVTRLTARTGSQQQRPRSCLSRCVYLHM